MCKQSNQGWSGKRDGGNIKKLEAGRRLRTCRSKNREERGREFQAEKAKAKETEAGQLNGQETDC